jgi:dTDP-4-amino-4,6-dideoxygalactose transaminase
MIPRLRLDIGTRDLLYALWRGARRDDPDEAARAAEAAWSEDAVAFLSVRSALDALLAVQPWPEGSEIILTSLTIPHVVQLVRSHGYVPVPLDLDPHTLAPAPEDVEAAITPRTRAIIAAHLFGARMDLRPVAEIADAHGLLLVEDCAQAYAGRSWQGHACADVSLFSFGTIKTATALGGAMATVRDRDLLFELRAHRDAWPAQPAAAWRRRVRLACLLRFLCWRPVFTLVFWSAWAAGRDLDRTLNRVVRSFPGPAWIPRLRQRPPAALMRLLARRLAADPAPALTRRAARGEAVRRALPSDSWVLGGLGHHHTHWLLPVVTPDPQRMVDTLRAAGFDATSTPSALAVFGPVRIRASMDRVVYVPTAIRAGDLPRLRAALAALEAPPVRVEPDQSTPAEGFLAPSPPSSEPALHRRAR